VSLGATIAGLPEETIDNLRLDGLRRRASVHFVRQKLSDYDRGDLLRRITAFMGAGRQAILVNVLNELRSQMSGENGRRIRIAF
jgi:hypothetical protein